jgi:hypothetical protein
LFTKSLHSIKRTHTKCFLHFVWFLVEKGQFTFNKVPNVLLAKLNVWPNQSALSERNAVHFVWSHNAPEGCRHGTHTNLMGRPTYEAPTREYTHKHKQTHNAARQIPDKVQYGADSRRGGALLIRGGRLAPTPSKLHLCRDLPRRRQAMCTATERRCACSARATSTSTSSLRSCFVLVLPFR